MKSILLVLMLCTGYSLHAQKDNSLLWEISGNGLQQPSYLFGTIHMICKEDFFMPQTVVQKFTGAQQVFLELDMDDPGMQTQLMKLAALPAGENLKKIFGSDYSMVDSFFQKQAGMSLAVFNGFKPMMVMSLMYMKMMPCEEQASYETSFMEMARQQKKDIKGLETVADQMRVFDNIPDSIEARNIVKMIKEFDQQGKQFADMVRVYKQQNVQELFKRISNSPDLMNAQEDLLQKRNNNWIPVMAENMKAGACFFAVGAGHLGGDVGLLVLLQKAGYQVKPVQTGE